METAKTKIKAKFTRKKRKMHRRSTIIFSCPDDLFLEAIERGHSNPIPTKRRTRSLSISKFRKLHKNKTMTFVEMLRSKPIENPKTRKKKKFLSKNCIMCAGELSIVCSSFGFCEKCYGRYT